MTQQDDNKTRDDEGEVQANLNHEESQKVSEMEHVPTSVIFEAIRREGDHELKRPLSALWWSGVTAGIAISTSVLCKGLFVSVLPDADWAGAVSNIGYTVGFLIVILARMQLFTENTITPILPMFIDPSWKKMFKISRLWLIVFTANMVGCLVAAVVMSNGDLIPQERFEGVLKVSRHYAEATPWQHLVRGMPAGFMIAALVWILPRMEGAGEVLMIFIITFMIGFGEMSHVVAGATELFLLVLRGEIGVSSAIFGGIFPAFAGNVIGGTGIFAVMTFAQVREEI
ncbi:Formate/nitrite transporter FocA, FNT family [Poseidonocella pacifica]|uniref:Formate/nitrite transporter FocA, FNT family n=1 Tax=Poseidonocella pacifica TaxID=871651 RepID=A0A1I0VRR2_9RHOB|nr:formate/nitrite transporter family protein [Poseidonocella pacifica]SFA79065.1 Formate/nitrite transporter FocA, FNT family [Poseidonocella pacifica]